MIAVAALAVFSESEAIAQAHPTAGLLSTTTVQAGTMQIHTIEPAAQRPLPSVAIETVDSCPGGCAPAGADIVSGIAGTANPPHGAPWEVSTYCGTPPIVPGGVVPAGNEPAQIGYTPFGPPSIGTWGIGSPDVEPGGAAINPCGPVYAPNWYVNADILTLFRDQTGDVAFASRGIGAGNVILSTREFQTDLESGMRLLIGSQLTESYSVEGLYFGLNHGRDQAAVRNSTMNAIGGTGILFSPFTGFGTLPVAGLDFNNFASISFSSELHNAEINFRRRMVLPPGRLFGSVLLGARFLQVDEGFGYFTVADRPLPGGATNRVDVNTDNDLYGLQLGTQLNYRVHPQWWLNFEIKGALCQNGGEQATTYTNVDAAGTITQFNGFRARHNTALIGDVDLSTGWQVTDLLAMRLGYKALWVDGVAIASENFEDDINILRLGPAEINRGSLIFHGPYAGVVATW